MYVCFFSTNISILDCTDLYIDKVLHVLWCCKYWSPSTRSQSHPNYTKQKSVHLLHSHHQTSPFLPFHALHGAFELTLNNSFTLTNNHYYEAIVATEKNGTPSGHYPSRKGVPDGRTVPQMPPLSLFLFLRLICPI